MDRIRNKIKSKAQGRGYREFEPEILPLCQGRVLDVGCADGIYLKYFSSASVGIEIEEGKAKLAKSNNLNVMRSDLNQSLPVKDGSFDVVFCSHVLEHLYSPYQFIGECRRVLKQDGKLIVALPTPVSLIRRLIWKDEYYGARHPAHLYAFSIKDITTLLQKWHFEEIDIIISYVIGRLVGKIFNASHLFKEIFQHVATAYWVIARK